MNKFWEVIKSIAIEVLFKDKEQLAKDVAKAIDIPMLSEEKEKQLSLAVIEVFEKAIKKKFD